MTSNIINKVKIILDDESIKDELLAIYIDNAIDYIKNYTNLTEIPTSLNSTLIEMTVYQYRNRELENVTSERIGNVSYTFTKGYPESITSLLDSHKRVTVV